MKDNVFIRTVKSFCLFKYCFDLKITRSILSLKKEVRYDLNGSCEACGKCCERPSIQVSFFTFHFKTFRFLYLLWQKKINQFEKIAENLELKSFMFKCHHWDQENRRCDSYTSRPGICRDYPRNLLSLKIPIFFEECGFYPVDKKAASFNASLDQLAISENKKNEIRKKLNLDKK